MSGGGWQEGEQGLPGLPGGHQGQGRGGSPPFSSDHGQGDIHRGRGTYSEGQGDIQRFLEDVEASGKPRCVSHLDPNISFITFLTLPSGPQHLRYQSALEDLGAAPLPSTFGTDLGAAGPYIYAFILMNQRLTLQGALFI